MINVMKTPKRYTPTFQELRAVEAVARHGSLSIAARELHVSQPTISYHIKRLEGRWGGKLFRVNGKKMENTDLVQDILSEIIKINSSIDDLSLRLASRSIHKPLTIGIAPPLASVFLISRLGLFSTENPNIPIRINATNRHVDLAEENIDLVLRLLPKTIPFQNSIEPNILIPVPNEKMRVVCSPEYLGNYINDYKPQHKPTIDIFYKATFIQEDNSLYW